MLSYKSYYSSYFEVIVGAHNLRNDTTEENTYVARTAYIHPDWQPAGNNLAILELDKSIDFNGILANSG